MSDPLCPCCKNLLGEETQNDITRITTYWVCRPCEDNGCDWWEFGEPIWVSDEE